MLNEPTSAIFAALLVENPIPHPGSIRQYGRRPTSVARPPLSRPTATTLGTVRCTCENLLLQLRPACVRAQIAPSRAVLAGHDFEAEEKASCERNSRGLQRKHCRPGMRRSGRKRDVNESRVVNGKNQNSSEKIKLREQEAITRH